MNVDSDADGFPLPTLNNNRRSRRRRPTRQNHHQNHRPQQTSSSLSPPPPPSSRETHQRHHRSHTKKNHIERKRRGQHEKNKKSHNVNIKSAKFVPLSLIMNGRSAEGAPAEKGDGSTSSTSYSNYHHDSPTGNDDDDDASNHSDYHHHHRRRRRRSQSRSHSRSRSHSSSSERNSKGNHSQEEYHADYSRRSRQQQQRQQQQPDEYEREQCNNNPEDEEDFSDDNKAQQSVVSSQYSYSSESSSNRNNDDTSHYNHRDNNDNSDDDDVCNDDQWQRNQERSESEEDEEPDDGPQLPPRHHNQRSLLTQNNLQQICQQQQQRCDGHAFTQFNIQSSGQPSSNHHDNNNHKTNNNNHHNNSIRRKENRSANTDPPYTKNNKADSDNETYSEEEDDEDEEIDEEAPLFGTSEFNSATDIFSSKHIQGEGWGVDYLQNRATRKKEKKNLEIEQRKQRRQKRKRKRWKRWKEGRSGWWGWMWADDDDDDDGDYDDDNVDDDVDFEDYHHSPFMCRGGTKSFISLILVFFLTFLAAIAFLEKDNLFGGSKRSKYYKALKNKQLSSQSSSKLGSKPSSRWGHRFDDDDVEALRSDDDVVLIDAAPPVDGTMAQNIGNPQQPRVPKYHHHSHNKSFSTLTPEQQLLEAEKWEDYEMEVASVFAGASTGWDINSKTGGVVVPTTDDNNNNNKTNADDGDDNGAEEKGNDGYTDHWVRYHDTSSKNYYYFHRETDTTQWEKPLMNEGVVLIGVAYGTGRDYVIEEGGHSPAVVVVVAEEGIVGAENVPLVSGGEDNDVDFANGSADDDFGAMEEEDDDPATSDFDDQEVLSRYRDSYWRWNHPYRIAQNSEVWGGIDAPVFWRIPLSGATTVEQIVTHCFHMIVAGTTGSNKDGKAVLSRNISEHLSVVTLEDGAHYLNFDMSTIEGIQQAKHAGLGRSGVADVILTRYLYNAAELFSNTGHTGRCFTMIRHPIDRAIAQFHNLKRNNVKAVHGMTINQYANSSIAEDNWMTRMITNTMEGKITKRHYEVAREVFGRKCLVGLFDKYSESMDRFADFFGWEDIQSINTRHPHASGKVTKEKDLAGKRECFRNMVKKGVNRHQYASVGKDSAVWKHFKKKNWYDLRLYEYAKSLYNKQTVVFEGDSQLR